MPGYAARGQGGVRRVKLCRRHTEAAEWRVDTTGYHVPHGPPVLDAMQAPTSVLVALAGAGVWAAGIY